MTERTGASQRPEHRFWLLLTALLALLVGYPYFVDSGTGAFLGGVRGDPMVEAAFTAFYAFTTVAVFLEVIKARRVEGDTLAGAVCVYLLVGLAFANLYDLIETLRPGSFQINVESAGGTAIGWRMLVFFSFMTLTTTGLGDVTPTTPQTQSLTSLEGVIGVLYVTVLVARIVGIYVRRAAEE